MKLGLYRLPVDGGHITGVVYQNKKGYKYFVAPNWLEPALVAIPNPERDPLKPLNEHFTNDLGNRLEYVHSGRPDPVIAAFNRLADES